MSDESLPPGWVKTALGDICAIHDSRRIPINASERNERIAGKSDAELYPYFGATGEVGKIDGFLFDGEYVLIGEDGAPFLEPHRGVSYLVNGKFWVNNHAHILEHPTSNRFLCHYLRQIDYRPFVTGTTRLKLNQAQMRKIPLPLPPLPEQKRIVAKIEELFSELEAGEESLRLARRQLGVYRQSLLKQAFEGKLTAQWRTQNPAKLESPTESEIPAGELAGFPDLPASWRYTRFGRSIRHIDAGKSFRCEERRPTPNEVGVAKVSAVTWGEYDEAESKTCIDPEKVNPDYFIRSGDFILSRANTIELVGACVIVRNVTQRVMLSDKTLRLTIDDGLKPFYLHYLRSRHGRREIEKRSTGNQESMRNIGQDRIRSIIVPKCSLPEQQEIVRLLDEQFEVIERNEREIDAALKRSEALRQAILKNAFTGRLVTQDPSDEPASTLLARLRAKQQVDGPLKGRSQYVVSK